MREKDLYLLDILSMRDMGLQLRMLTIKRFLYLGVSLVSQKILYILVSASCQLRVINMRRRIFVDMMETRSIRIAERATPYHITQLRSITSPPTSPLQFDDKCEIVNLNYTLVINLPSLHLNLIKA